MKSPATGDLAPRVACLEDPGGWNYVAWGLLVCMGDLHKLTGLAGRQGCVVSAEQLYRLGFTDREIEGLVARGALYRIYHGVYAIVPRQHLTVKGHLTAARVAAGEHAFFSDHTAAAIRGLEKINTRRIEMTIPVGHTPPQRTGLIFHRTRTEIDWREVGWCGGFRVSTVPRLLIELSGRRARNETLEGLLAEAVRNNIFDPHALEKMLTRHDRRPGVGRLKEVADYYRPLPDRKSEFERIFDRETADRSEIPPCERNVMLGDDKHGVWEIDCWWPAQRVALELDGRRYHTALQDYDKDRRKDTALQLMRIFPMRASYWMWKRDKEGVIADLLGLLALSAAA